MLAVWAAAPPSAGGPPARGGEEGTDPRLPAETPVFAFRLGARTYAAPHAAIAGGAVFDVGGGEIFLFRPRDGARTDTTSAYFAPTTGPGHAPRFEQRADRWRDVETEAVFVEGKGFQPPPEGGHVPPLERPLRLAGIDTAWHVWSGSHAGVVLLVAPAGDEDG
jgi:hypothetical protein